MKNNLKRISISAKPINIAVLILAFVLVLSVPVTGWFSHFRTLAAYAPIAKPESLYIGSGHRNFDSVNKVFTDDYAEDIKYLYLKGIDTNDGKDYYDYVFCVYGKAIHQYKLQIAFTTNNPFTYDIFNATENLTDSEGAVPHTTHSDTPQTYYYVTNGNALVGNYLNRDGNLVLATNAEHELTYGQYNNVQKNAEPLYWQTLYAQPGNSSGEFINYYILRVSLNGKTTNDRETDIICIAAKSA